MIPKTGWRDMESAPKDGTIIFVVSNLYNKGGQPRQVQSAQWLCETDGKNWDWRRPWSSGWKVYADGWMHVDEFYAAMQNIQPEDATIPPADDFEPDDLDLDLETPAGMSAANAPQEFDL